MRLSFRLEIESGVWRSSLLDAESSWLEHGFGGRAAAEAGWPGSYLGVRQIHSDVVALASECGVIGGIGGGGSAESGSPQGDAIVTGDPGHWIGVRTADCVPVLIADPVRRCIGAIHAGWRGAASNIVAATVRKMTQLCESRSQDLVVAIGPAIGRCCFEVGPEVLEQFAQWFPEQIDDRKLDLMEANRRQLVAEGVRSEAIDIAWELCTKCDPASFHSWRRDREESGRMVAAIRITD